MENRPSQHISKKSIDFDLKLVRGFALSYFIYGLVYWIQIKEFLVPLPMVYFFVPVAGFIMFVRSIKWWAAFVLLLIPFVVLKDLTLYAYPNVSGVLLLLTFLSWSGIAWYIFYKDKDRSLSSWVFPISQSLIWLVWLVKGQEIQLTMTLMILIGATMFVRKHINDANAVYHLRIGLLIQLVVTLFLMQKISMFWVS
jgi:hypothetical protein